MEIFYNEEEEEEQFNPELLVRLSYDEKQHILSFCFVCPVCQRGGIPIPFGLGILDPIPRERTKKTVSAGVFCLQCIPKFICVIFISPKLAYRYTVNNCSSVDHILKAQEDPLFLAKERNREVLEIVMRGRRTN